MIARFATRIAFTFSIVADQQRVEARTIDSARFSISTHGVKRFAKGLLYFLKKKNSVPCLENHSIALSRSWCATALAFSPDTLLPLTLYIEKTCIKNSCFRISLYLSLESKWWRVSLFLFSSARWRSRATPYLSHCSFCDVLYCRRVLFYNLTHGAR